MNPPADAFELIIFDWDGTLMDSAAEIVAAIRESIAALGLPAREDGQIARMIGLGLDDAFARLYPAIEAAELNAVVNEYRQRFSARPKVYGQAFAGVEDTLHQLAGQGCKLAVATGKSRRGLDRSLVAERWQQRFDATRCADETASKPHPRMLLELLEELSIAPQRALMVGDTSYDMAMARSAGVTGLGVSCGVHEDDEMLAAGAATVLPGVPHLLRWLRPA